MVFVCSSSFVFYFLAGKVYNMTQYIRFHPGGKEELMKGAGIDCTIIFDEVSIFLSQSHDNYFKC